jgi:diaminohydroxyphosphoribosylaminopyrimidine deaminase/5-amino-6-(5-phosphoribosylamino)uracil reductase
MTLALQLAERGLYTTTPNPRVGCVLVREGKIIGTGWHQRAGEPHAEILALRMAAEQSRGATAYVTLEPCSHHGRTPPCADALVNAGIQRVVVAMQDPNPLVAGRGLSRLAAAGITVECGLLETEARQLNPGFIKRMRHNLPWLRIKTAASMDGRTALTNGVSQWITGAAARQDVHAWRARSCAILTGIGTILADNPRLNVRDVETSRQPLRIVLDSHLRTPLHAHILDTPGTLIACAHRTADRAQALEARGAEILTLPNERQQIDLPRLLSVLAQRGVNEVMVEAGATLNGALLEQYLVDEWVAYFAPMLMGNSARGLFALPEFTDLSQAQRGNILDVRQTGEDWRFVVRFSTAEHHT